MLRRITFALGLILSFNLCASNTAQIQFNHLTVFGDSLSDNGNLYDMSWHFLPKSPPYFEGRFSNGMVWSELLAHKYFNKEKEFGDYAVGGAGAVLSTNEVLPYTLAKEIKNYTDDSEKDKAKSTLFVVWIGANNYLYVQDKNKVKYITDKVINGIESGVTKLIENKAQMIVIANLPDIGATPEVRANGEKSIELGHNLTVTHNQKLHKMYERLSSHYPNVRFVYFDAYKLFTEAMEHPEKFGVNDTETPCYTGGVFFKSALGDMAYTTIADQELFTFFKAQLESKNKSMSDEQINSYLQNPVTREALQNAYFAALAKKRGFSFSSEKELDCSGYLFWDHVHPTKQVHQYIMQYFADAIKEANLVPTLAK